MASSLYWARKTNSRGCVEPGKSLTDAVENTLQNANIALMPRRNHPASSALQHFDNLNALEVLEKRREND